MAPGVLGLKVGELVEVRSAEEIRATLDENGELGGLPFMPEMLAFCGRRLTVHKVAHKSCDNIARTGLRRMTDAVHLTESRCDGSAHGGCENALLAVLEGAVAQARRPRRPGSCRRRTRVIGCSCRCWWRRRRSEPFEDGEPRYSCQATEMLRATPQPHAAQGPQPVPGGRHVRQRRRPGGPPVLPGRRVQPLPGPQQAVPARASCGSGAACTGASCKGGVTSGRTPTEHLDLRPGELVRIKSREEILATLDADLLNRGMGFDAEMSRFCGRTARVKARANRCVDEKTGRMLTMKNPCIILEDIVCEGAFSANCPREFVCWWREIWLERVERLGLSAVQPVVTDQQVGRPTTLGRSDAGPGADCAGRSAATWS